jgi:hypothetical protein
MIKAFKFFPQPCFNVELTLGLATQRNVDTILAYARNAVVNLEDIPDLAEPPISELSDDAVLELADAKMNPAQNHCLGDLQTKHPPKEKWSLHYFPWLKLIKLPRSKQPF